MGLEKLHLSQQSQAIERWHLMVLASRYWYISYNRVRHKWTLSILLCLWNWFFLAIMCTHSMKLVFRGPRKAGSWYVSTQALYPLSSVQCVLDPSPALYKKLIRWCNTPPPSKRKSKFFKSTWHTWSHNLKAYVGMCMHLPVTLIIAYWVKEYQLFFFPVQASHTSHGWKA
jgi:hypothetical protein